MLHIHHAHRFETLTALLLARLGRGPADVFAAEQLIVPSTAVRRALTLTLAIAEHRRVCTKVQFSYLAQWLWQQMSRCVAGVPAQSPYMYSRCWPGVCMQPCATPNSWPRTRAWPAICTALMR